MVTEAASREIDRKREADLAGPDDEHIGVVWVRHQRLQRRFFRESVNCHAIGIMLERPAALYPINEGPDRKTQFLGWRRYPRAAGTDRMTQSPFLVSRIGAARRRFMRMKPAASLPGLDNCALIGEADLLPRHPSFHASDLASACQYLSGVFAPHRQTYLTRERRLNFRHRCARLDAVELNALAFGGDVRVDAPHIPDYFLVQFTLAGSCALSQGGRTYDMGAGSVAVINPCRPFTKSWSPDARQILLRIDRGLLQRELLAWTGRDPREPIEFDQSQAFAMETVATLTHVVRMLCEVLRGESSSLDHPLVRNRVASTVASALLVGLPHNHSPIFDAAKSSIAPASVRRAVRFIEDNVHKAIGLADVACAAGISPRALQMAFRRFRDTTPMAHLRALRLDLARSELARASDGSSVTSVAIGHGFGSLSRFAADYKARFHESPSETLRRGMKS